MKITIPDLVPQLDRLEFFCTHDQLRNRADIFFLIVSHLEKKLFEARNTAGFKKESKDELRTSFRRAKGMVLVILILLDIEF